VLKELLRSLRRPNLYEKQENAGLKLDRQFSAVTNQSAVSISSLIQKQQ
jgi:hypothetical protein